MTIENQYIIFLPVQQEDPEEDRVEEDWIEMKNETNHIVCLLCSNQSKSYEDVLSHMLLEHKFDFSKITEKCNFYEKVTILIFDGSMAIWLGHVAAFHFTIVLGENCEFYTKKHVY